VRHDASGDTPWSEGASAEVVRWQSPYRLALAGALIAGGAIAALAGWRAPGLPPAARAPATIGALAAVLVPYAAFVAALTQAVARRRRAGRWVVSALSVADVLVLCLLVVLTSRPADYDRALLGGVLVLPLTYVYFGRRPALLTLAALAAGYVALVDRAIGAGAGGLAWGPALVTLALAVGGGLVVVLVQGEGHERLARLAAAFARAEAGEVDATYDVAADRRPDAITGVGRAYNRMREQLATIVLTDPLSGTLNRRGFAQEYRRVLARAARARGPVALLAIDLDHFKEVNDTHGHLEGDQVIAQVGALLAQTARAGDVVARTGGEEFVLLLPETPLEGALHLGERLVEAFRARAFGRGGQVVLTTSVGVAADVVHDESVAEDLRSRADEALYAAKRGGRDRVVPWSRALAEGRRAAATLRGA
jgi:diguanylate cyclase (GGDEF)-like protein